VAGRITGRSLDARKEEEIAAFLRRPMQRRSSKSASSTSGANVNFPLLETTERVSAKVWELACYAGFSDGARSGTA